jgi:hypothetical protein
MITAVVAKLEQGEEFQRIKSRIKNTLSLPIDNLGKASGAPTIPNTYNSRFGEEELVSIFRRILNVGSPEYEHELARFLQNGPPNMNYVWLEENDKPDTRTPDELLVAAVANKIKAEREATDRANKTLVVLRKEDLELMFNEKFVFQCYIPSCEFVGNDTEFYERHVVTCHYGKGLCYPGKIDIKMRGWTAQGRKWES